MKHKDLTIHLQKFISTEELPATRRQIQPLNLFHVVFIRHSNDKTFQALQIYAIGFQIITCF